MHSPNRRKTIARIAALGASALAHSPVAWALRPDHDAPSAAGNQLLIPKDEGPFAYFAPRGEPVKLRVVEQAESHWPLAYEVESKGKLIRNPTFVVQRGERLRVELQNRLSEATITHWHGLTVNTRNDGAGMLLAAPGASFAYDFDIRDRAGLYWYHPHPHAHSASQVYRGLFGMFIIEDGDESILRSALDLVPGETEIPLVLQDHRPGREYEPTTMEEFHGYLGSTVFINGGEYPHLYATTRLYRFRVLNASNARTYRLAFRTQSGNLIPFTLIGTDNGFLTTPARCQEVFLATAERVDLLVDLSDVSVGDLIYLTTRLFDPMHNEMNMVHHDIFPDGGIRDLMELRINRSVRYAANVPAQPSPRPLIDTSHAQERSIRLSFTEGKWRINDLVFEMGATPIQVRRNTVETWVINNPWQSMPHAMHLHGFHFDVVQRQNSPVQIAALKVDDSGRLATDLGSRDTVLVWPGETVRIAYDFTLPATPAFAGDQSYVFHCHNLEHEDAGMMLGVKVT